MWLQLIVCIMTLKSIIITSLVSLGFGRVVQAQTSVPTDSSNVYKKRVLESTEVDILSSYYSQDGDNAAVTGGIGTEALTDITSTIVIAIPLNDDDVLTIDAGISAYTSASSSNVNPFDDGYASPYVASSGASASDVWSSGVISYSHSSNDRNSLWSAKLSVAAEYDYFSIGFGGSYTKLFNEKNTELGIHGSVYLDTWKIIYPFELRPFAQGGAGLSDGLFQANTITGHANYQPMLNEINSKGRNSYALGSTFSQILNKNLQGTLAIDVIKQDGQLATPFQRVYFSDVANSYIDDFHLADAVEQLPNSRFKVALGGRLHYFINEFLTVRTYYRYYFDDWGINSHTANIELPVKISDKFTLYPSYRFYTQTAAHYFKPYDTHLSTAEFYTSDYDLSNYSSNQFGFGASYTDIFTKMHLWKFGLKSIDLKYYHYKRNNTLSAHMITGGFKFIMD
ncbi:hypothetical protein IA57_09545 [Mangrovimonas yunxiaonensis]|uniref:DUF3570 domain-containing protein n=2 Tax=Mangrovimonas yunxiaonensis TaxID=1197477 RepID=A0A084TJ11_9FLAO|nr:hypothetical protein IA57_09545 [Mangrovimonas yunxiaonensis]GGH46278.1 hypothetical protein GCM10011364_20340 [Mangrovimonas yunxiaonensis]